MDRPETGYGYIKYSDNYVEVNEERFIKVDKFVEKPDLVKAKRYLRDGNYLWNGGMFLWKVENILNEIREYCPSIYEPLKGVQSVDINEIKDVINENYNKTEAISIDYAVLEKSKEI